MLHGRDHISMMLLYPRLLPLHAVLAARLGEIAVAVLARRGQAQDISVQHHELQRNWIGQDLRLCFRRRSAR